MGLLLVLMLLGLAAVGGRLFWVQVYGQQEVLEASYSDVATLSLLDDLLAKGVLGPGPQGEVLVDQEALAREVPRQSTRDRVRRAAQAARLKPGQTGFDHRLVRVLAPGLRPGRPDVLRGALLDRSGRPLALSQLNSQGTAQERIYPLGAAASQPLGFHHPIFGNHGLEASLDRLLSQPAAPAEDGHPAAGWDLQLTLDADLQQRAHDLLAGRTGAVVALDVASGAILAAAGSPAFDTNQKDPNPWRRARSDDQGRLLLCRPWERIYPPGSTFKLLVAAAWLEAHPGQEPPVINCTGHDKGLNIGDIKPHGRTDFTRALVKSCNIYFARLGVSLGDKPAALAERLGFNRTRDLIPQEPGLRLIAQPSLAYASWRYQPVSGKGPDTVRRQLERFTTFRRDYRIAAQCAIGQNLVSATVLQMASLAQVIANKGLMMPPHLVSGWMRPRGETDLHILTPVHGEQVISMATAQRLAGAMAQVMTRGTGRSAPPVLTAGEPLALAGKTGTADTGRPDEAPHAWFVGFAPAENPKVAVAVLLENAGLGGRVAAPLGAEVLAAALGAEVVLAREGD
jgi:peptidoglycan glycosyltransferase